MPRYFRTPFAENGDSQQIPYTSATTEVSYDKGYTPEYELPKTNPDRRNIDRQPFNGIMKDVTENTKFWQDNAFPEIVSDRGDGNPVEYARGFIGKLGGVTYQAVASLTSTVPPSNEWIVYEDYNSNISKRIGSEVAGTKSVNDIDVDGVLEITPDDGRYITLTGHGAADFEISGFGTSCPVGYVFEIEIPRTIGDTGQTPDSLGNYVQFIHTSGVDGIDMTLNKRLVNGSPLYTYQAYPNASDVAGSAFSYSERLKFICVDQANGRWKLAGLPNTSTGSNANGDYIVKPDNSMIMFMETSIPMDSGIVNASIGAYPVKPVSIDGCSHSLSFGQGLVASDRFNLIMPRPFSLTDMQYSSSGEGSTNSRSFTFTIHAKWKPEV